MCLNTATGDERFVRRMRQSSTSDAFSDSTSDSDEKEVATAKPSNVAARAAAVAATGQQQISIQAQRQSLPSPQQKLQQQKLQQQKQQQKQQSRSGVKKSRRRGRESSVASEQTMPLKTDSTTKPELVEPLKRAMSSDLIPVDDGAKPKANNNTSSDDNNAQAKSNPRGFSIMDDGWGV